MLSDCIRFHNGPLHDVNTEMKCYLICRNKSQELKKLTSEEKHKFRINLSITKTDTNTNPKVSSCSKSPEKQFQI